MPMKEATDRPERVAAPLGLVGLAVAAVPVVVVAPAPDPELLPVGVPVGPAELLDDVVEGHVTPVVGEGTVTLGA